MDKARISPLGDAPYGRRWWLVAGLASLLFAALASRSEAAVFVSYGLQSSSSAVGSHQFSFNASKGKVSDSSTLAITIQKIDTRGTASASDDVTQSHTYSFTLPGDAVQINDTLGSASIKTGSLVPLAGSAGAAPLNYGKLDLMFTMPGAIKRTSSPCSTFKERPGTWRGTFNFNSGLAGIGRIRRTSLAGDIARSTFKTPCTTPPSECFNTLLLTAAGVPPKEGGSSFLSLFKGPTFATYYISFREDSVAAAPASVTHAMSGPLPPGSFRLDSLLRTGKFDAGPLPGLEGVVTFAKNAAPITYPIEGCPAAKRRTGTLSGMIDADFAAGNDHTFIGGTASAFRTRK